MSEEGYHLQNNRTFLNQVVLAYNRDFDEKVFGTKRRRLELSLLSAVVHIQMQTSTEYKRLFGFFSVFFFVCSSHSRTISSILYASVDISSTGGCLFVKKRLQTGRFTGHCKRRKRKCEKNLDKMHHLANKTNEAREMKPAKSNFQ